jgi:multimeric flavodoxin WrbA
MNEVYDEIVGAKYLLVATPVYFMGPPGSLKGLIDRFQAVWARSAILKTFTPDNPERQEDHKAFIIITAATPDRPPMYRPALSIVKAFLNVTGFDCVGQMVAGGLESKDDARARADLLKQAFTAGAAFIP